MLKADLLLTAYFYRFWRLSVCTCARNVIPFLRENPFLGLELFIISHQVFFTKAI